MQSAKPRAIHACLRLFLLLSLLVLLACDAKAVAAVLRARLYCCLETLIPSLFGCMAVANLLLESGAVGVLGNLLRKPARLLHWSAETAGVFVISQLAGYPVGASLLAEMARAGRILPEDAQRLTAVCYGGGPAFLVGMAGAELFGSVTVGWVMFAACVLANLVMAILLRPHTTPDTTAESAAEGLTPAVLIHSVERAWQSLGRICGIVLGFGIVYRLLIGSGLPNVLSTWLHLPGKWICGMMAVVLDVARLPQLFECGIPWQALLPLTAGLLSFGGICVQAQVIAMQPGISGMRLILERLAAATLAGIWTCLFLPMIPDLDAVATFSPQMRGSESGSILPAIFIFLSGFPMFLKKDWTNQKNCDIMKKR